MNGHIPNVVDLLSKASMRTGDRRKPLYRMDSDGASWLIRCLRQEIARSIQSALRRPRLELVREARLQTSDILECKECIDKRKNRIAGQAITGFECKYCNRMDSHSNTATPNLCQYCAFRTFKCRRCMQSLDKDIETA